jgi:hypothetical protein
MGIGGPQATSCVDTNLTLDQGKPRCIKPILLVFYFESYFIFYYDCALSL